MTYNLKTSDGAPLVSLPDNTIDNTTTSIALVGKNSLNFGYSINQDLIYLMQHFADTASPINPLIGQIWYDTVNAVLKVYNGNLWVAVMPPTDGQAGAAILSINSNEVTAFLSNGLITAIVSHAAIPRPNIPASVLINDINYALGTRFPYGITPGVTLAVDNNSYKFAGKATEADRLSNVVSISLSNAVTGSAKFTGAGNVTISTRLSDVTTAGTYHQVTVAANGQVMSGNINIDPDVIISSLGYEPISNIQILGDIAGVTTVSGSIANVLLSLTNYNVAGTYNQVTVNDNGIVIAGLDVGSSSGASGPEYVFDTGTVNALAVAITPVPISYAVGMMFLVNVSFTNTGPATVNVNGLGPKTITQGGSALVANALESGQTYFLVYDGVYFEVLSSSSSNALVSNSMLDFMPANTVKGNISNVTAQPMDVPISTLLTGLGFETGQYGFFSTTTLSANWAVADGSEILRSTPLGILYASEGYPYGHGNGSTTCNLPNFLGVFPRGLNTSGSGPDAGRTLGSLQQDQIETHNHANGIGATTGSPRPFTYGDTDAGQPGAAGSTAHTDANTASRQGYTSDGTVAPGAGSGNPSGTFGSETRPINLPMVIAVHL